MSVQEKILSPLIKNSLRLLMKQAGQKSPPLKALRTAMDASATLLPKSPCTTQAQNLGGVHTVVCSSNHPLQQSHQNFSSAVILFIHGGAFVVGSPKSHTGLAGKIAGVTGLNVYLPDYRLAPEHPYPAAVNDVFAVYSALLGKGYAPSQIMIMGDSAGGGLTLALALYLKQQGMQQPAGLIMLSPWVDLSLSSATCQSNKKRDPMLSLAFLQRGADAYCQQLNKRDAKVSPLFADLSDLAPMLIQVGSEEVLLDDARQLHANAKAHGVNCQLNIAQGMWHGYQLFFGLIPSANQAISQISAFVHQRISV